MFTPVTTRAGVPLVGAGFETPLLDLKAHPDAYAVSREKRNAGWNEFELAKDVAAFANHSGGTILLGATQNKVTGACDGHAPFALEAAEKFEVALHEALANRCYPRPLVDVTRVAFDDRVMLAVNVWPFPGQAVGVRVRSDKTDGFGGFAYVFPVRVLSHTNYLPAEQLAMLMSPDVRRAAVLLSTLKAGAAIVLHPRMVIEPDKHTHKTDVTFVRLDEMKNCVVLKANDAASAEVGVPLDDLVVWYEGDRCHIQCDRRLMFRS